MVVVLTVIVEMKETFTKEAFEFLELDKLSIVVNIVIFYAIITTIYVSGGAALLLFYIFKANKVAEAKCTVGDSNTRTDPEDQNHIDSPTPSHELPCLHQDQEEHTYNTQRDSVTISTQEEEPNNCLSTQNFEMKHVTESEASIFDSLKNNSREAEEELTTNLLAPIEQC